MEWEKREQIKEKYAGGTEYFLYTGSIYPIDPLIVLLKAFSHFKKWQLSNMKLIMAGPANRKTEKLIEKLATYKYREDVVMIENPVPEMVQELIAAAYAPIHLSENGEELGKKLLLLYKDETLR